MTSRLELARRAAEAGATLAMEGFRTPIDVETKSGPLDSVTELDRAVQRRVSDILRLETPDATVVGEETVEGVESVQNVPDSGFAWIVDPIDGTNNYVAGNRNWGVAIGAVEDGEPVLAVNRFPALGDEYEAHDAAGDDPPGATRNGDRCSVSARTDASSFTINPIFGVNPSHRRAMADYVDVIVDEFGDMRRFGCAQLALSAVAAGELDAAVSAVRLHAWDTVAGVHLVRRAGGLVTDVHGDRWTPGSEGLIASNGEAHARLVDAFDVL